MSAIKAVPVKPPKIVLYPWDARVRDRYEPRYLTVDQAVMLYLAKR